jgi:hypothetical protein
MFLVAGEVHAATDPVLNAKLEETIAKVRAGKPSAERTEAAEHLAKLTHRVNPASVDQKTVSDMISLLDIPDDSVRGWTAAALGNLGRRAKAAVPKLLALLPEVDCLQGDLSSAASVRPALKRLGANLPPAPSYNDCHKPN